MEQPTQIRADYTVFTTTRSSHGRSSGGGGSKARPHQERDGEGAEAHDQPGEESRRHLAASSFAGTSRPSRTSSSSRTTSEPLVAGYKRHADGTIELKFEHRMRANTQKTSTTTCSHKPLFIILPPAATEIALVMASPGFAAAAEISTAMRTNPPTILPTRPQFFRTRRLASMTA